MHFIKDL